MCSLTLIYYVVASYLALIFGLVLVHTWVRVTTIGYATLILLYRLVALQNFMSSLTVVIFEGASYFAFMRGVVLVRIWVKSTIVGYVSLILF